MLDWPPEVRRAWTHSAWSGDILTTLEPEREPERREDKEREPDKGVRAGTRGGQGQDPDPDRSADDGVSPSLTDVPPATDPSPQKRVPPAPPKNLATAMAGLIKAVEAFDSGTRQTVEEVLAETSAHVAALCELAAGTRDYWRRLVVLESLASAWPDVAYMRGDGATRAEEARARWEMSSARAQDEIARIRRDTLGADGNGDGDGEGGGEDDMMLWWWENPTMELAWVLGAGR
ncbi:hypothetical protein ColTof4_14314 [Colletotrichum tofieldiae]|nr:hypothetical protein ColTof4_14314 [Colletotrichum tofieldiae]